MHFSACCHLLHADSLHPWVNLGSQWDREDDCPRQTGKLRQIQVLSFWMRTLVCPFSHYAKCNPLGSPAGRIGVCTSLDR
jgi:hypothetical protein